MILHWLLLLLNPHLSNQAFIDYISKCLFYFRLKGCISGNLFHLKKSLAEELVKVWHFKRYFNRTERIILVFGANVHSFVSLLSQRELRVSKFGLKCMKVCTTSALQNVKLWLVLMTLETPVPLAGGHLKPGLIMDMGTTSVVLNSEWECQMSLPLLIGNCLTEAQLPKITLWFLKTVEVLQTSFISN